MIFEVLLAFFGLLAFVYLVIKRKQTTLIQSHGIKVAPVPNILGNMPFFNTDIFLGKKNVNEVAREQYEVMKGEKMYGFYVFGTPGIIFTDPEWAKQILVRDFNIFGNRASKVSEIAISGRNKADEIWRKQMVFTVKDTWKGIRATFSPVFTSGKLKTMLAIIRDISQRLIDHVEQVSSSGTDVDLKEAFGKFTMDAIATSVFGVDAQSFSSSQTPFVVNARNFFRRGFVDFVKITMTLIPKMVPIFDLLGIAVMKPMETEFFAELVERTLSERRKSKIRRNDMIDLILDAIEESQETGMDELTIIATAVVFLIAGYDTTSQTLTYAGYELAMNPDIQQRLQDEIDDAYEEADGEIPNYSVIQEMKYLDMVIHETLRKHPPVGLLQRSPVENYIIQGTDYVLERGSEVMINVIGIHMDPKYYLDPEKFNPEHFSKESKENRHPYAFLGFGQGPRSCIGMRFALLEIKVALVMMLRKFSINQTENTVKKITLDPSCLFGAPKDKIQVRMTQRN